MSLMVVSFFTSTVISLLSLECELKKTFLPHIFFKAFSSAEPNLVSQRMKMFSDILLSLFTNVTWVLYGPKLLQFHPTIPILSPGVRAAPKLYSKLLLLQIKLSKNIWGLVGAPPLSLFLTNFRTIFCFRLHIWNMLVLFYHKENGVK